MSRILLIKCVYMILYMMLFPFLSCACIRLGLSSITLPCPPCCGSVSAHVCFIRRPYCGRLSSRRARLPCLPPSGPCSGQWCLHSETRIHLCPFACPSLLMTLYSSKKDAGLNINLITIHPCCLDNDAAVSMFVMASVMLKLWERMDGGGQDKLEHIERRLQTSVQAQRPPRRQTWLVKESLCPSQNHEPSVSMEGCRKEKEERAGGNVKRMDYIKVERKTINLIRDNVNCQSRMQTHTQRHRHNLVPL